jgi:hypothetical protein
MLLPEITNRFTEGITIFFVIIKIFDFTSALYFFFKSFPITAETIVSAVLYILNEYLIGIQDICLMIAIEKFHPLALRSNQIIQ